MWTQHPVAALRAPRAGQGARAARRRTSASSRAPVGGGFGGKRELFQHEAAAAKLAMLTGRPVKIGAHARRSLLLPPRSPPGADVGQDRLNERRHDHGHALPDRSSTAARTAATARRRCTTRARCRRCAQQIPRYRCEGAARASRTSRRAAPSAATARPSRAIALECHFDTVAERPGHRPVARRCAARTFVAPITQTVNHLRITSCGLRECIDIVARESRLRASGTASCRSARASAWPSAPTCAAPALPLYWNDMPHSSVDMSGSTAAAA